MTHGGYQLTGLDVVAFGFDNRDGFFDSGLHRLNGFIEGETRTQVLLWSPAKFAIDHAIGVQVEHKLTSHSGKPVLGLHHSDGVFKGF